MNNDLWLGWSTSVKVAIVVGAAIALSSLLPGYLKWRRKSHKRNWRRIATESCSLILFAALLTPLAALASLPLVHPIVNLVERVGKDGASVIGDELKNGITIARLNSMLLIPIIWGVVRWTTHLRHLFHPTVVPGLPNAMPRPVSGFGTWEAIAGFLLFPSSIGIQWIILASPDSTYEPHHALSLSLIWITFFVIDDYILVSSIRTRTSGRIPVWPTIRVYCLMVAMGVLILLTAATMRWWMFVVTAIPVILGIAILIVATNDIWRKRTFGHHNLCMDQHYLKCILGDALSAIEYNPSMTHGDKDILSAATKIATLVEKESDSSLS